MQKVTFDDQRVKMIFHGSFHKVSNKTESDILLRGGFSCRKSSKLWFCLESQKTKNKVRHQTCPQRLTFFNFWSEVWYIKRSALLCSPWHPWDHAGTADASDSKCGLYFRGKHLICNSRAWVKAARADGRVQAVNGLATRTAFYSSRANHLS